MSLYEGTTGIQSLDLLGRKVTMKGGKALMLVGQEMGETINAANTFDELKPYAAILGKQMHMTVELVQFLSEFAKAGEYERFLSDATLFMEYFGTILIGWQWLKQGLVASRALESGGLFSNDFYESKLKTMEYFFNYELVKNHSLYEILGSRKYITLKNDNKESLI